MNLKCDILVSKFAFTFNLCLLHKGLCSDKCINYFVETAISLDEFDSFCANRKAGPLYKLDPSA